MAHLVEGPNGIELLDSQDRLLLTLGLDGSLTLPGDLTVEGDGHVVGEWTGGDAVVARCLLSSSHGVATTPGTVTGKVEIYDALGVSIGWLPVYDAIT